MNCPRCGRQDAQREIAPGYFECGALLNIEDPTFDLVPGVPAPVQRASQMRICAHRYQVATMMKSAATCSFCTTFAIGVCATCGEPVCGDDSARHQGQRLCLADLPAAVEDTRRTLEEAKDAMRQRSLERIATPAGAFDEAFLRFTSWEIRYLALDKLQDLGVGGFTRTAIEALPGAGVPTRHVKYLVHREMPKGRWERFLTDMPKYGPDETNEATAWEMDTEKQILLTADGVWLTYHGFGPSVGAKSSEISSPGHWCVRYGLHNDDWFAGMLDRMRKKRTAKVRDCWAENQRQLEDLRRRPNPLA